MCQKLARLRQLLVRLRHRQIQLFQLRLGSVHHQFPLLRDHDRHHHCGLQQLR